MFSLYDAALMRPLPVSHPEQLVRMVQRLPKPLGLRSEFPFAYYTALREHSKMLESVFAETVWSDYYRMTEPEPAEEITAHGVTPEFFEALGVRPFLGRFPQSGGAVVSYQFWHRRFGGSSDSLKEQTLTIHDHVFPIVGVMPRGINGLSVDSGPDVRIPLRDYVTLSPDIKLEQFEVAGRLRPGVTLAQAQAECLSIWRAVMKDYYREIEKVPAESAARLLARGMELQSLERGTSVVRDNFGDVLKLLMASVGLLLVIVFLNVAGLLLARAAARQREMAVRLALGATRLRLVRQLMVEGLLLAAGGAGGGLIVSLIMLPLAARMLPPIRDMYTAVIPVALDADLNWRVLCFLVASSVAATIIFTIVPAMATARTVRSKISFRGRQLLITAQIALCTFLLAAAGLLVHSFELLRATPSGLATDSIATFHCDPGASKYPAGAMDALLERVRQVPGIVSVATSSSGVLRGHGLFTTAAPAGQRITHSDFLDANANVVSRDYFATMGMRLQAGREFLPSDNQEKPAKVIVNEEFVRRIFPHTSGIERLFGAGTEGSVAPAADQIVGVVSDAKYRSLRDPIHPMVYSLQAGSDSNFILNVRTSANPGSIIGPVREALSSVAPGLAVLETGTLAEAVEEITAPERMTASLASLFGAMAALLAGIGTYGLLAYAVAQRRREIGIRMALGAKPGNVARLVARQTFAMTSVGVTAGLGGAMIAAPAFRSLLYGISPLDPVAMIVAGIFVIVVSALATVGPASQAVQIEPAEALRLEA